MSDEGFSFDDEIKDVLKRPQGRPTISEKKNKKIACYLTDEEYNKLLKHLDERPISGYLRKLIIKDIN